MFISLTLEFLGNTLLTVFSYYLTNLSDGSDVWMKRSVFSNDSNDHPVLCSSKLSFTISHNNALTTLAAAGANEKFVKP